MQGYAKILEQDFIHYATIIGEYVQYLEKYIKHLKIYIKDYEYWEKSISIWDWVFKFHCQLTLSDKYQQYSKYQFDLNEAESKLKDYRKLLTYFKVDKTSPLIIDMDTYMDILKIEDEYYEALKGVTTNAR